MKIVTKIEKEVWEAYADENGLNTVKDTDVLADYTKWLIQKGEELSICLICDRKFRKHGEE